MAQPSRSASGLIPQPILGGVKVRTRSRVEVVRPDLHEADRDLVNGLGGLGFRSLSPPGSGRLVRIPFYPLNATQSWTGANGIDEAGDDPVLDMTIAVGSSRSARYTMLTYQFDYGAYKILGLQTNFQESYDTGMEAPVPAVVPVPVTPPGASPECVAIAVGTLSLYNGQTLFVQLEDMDAASFQVLPSARSNFLAVGGPPASMGSQRENPYNYLARRSRFFPGMRDYPVVFGTSNVTMQVSAFIGRALTVASIDIPFSCYLVADLVEDYVFGDPVNGSVSARAGANVKLGVKDMGLSPIDPRSRTRTHQYDLSSARYTKKT